MTNIRLAFLSLLLAVTPTLSWAAFTDEDLARRATDFANAVVAENYDAARAMSTSTMQEALKGDAFPQLRTSLVAKMGAIKSAGQAWASDTVSGYRRFRVPVSFESGMFDFQIVFDADGLVAGMGVQPYSPQPAKEDPATAAWRELELNVGPEGRALPGTLTLPKTGGPFPGVVLVHGSGPNDRDESSLGNKPFRDIARGLAARGIASLRYDKRTFARPKDFAEVGAKLTVKEESIDDAAAAIKVLSRRTEIDPKRVFVLGHSLGGQLAPRIAKAAKVAGMIVMAGSALPMPEKMIEQADYLARVDGTVSAEEQKNLDMLEQAVAALRVAMKQPDASSKLYLGAPSGYFKDLEAHNAPAETAALGLPVLVLQGKRDYQVTMADFAEWQKALTGKKGACLRSYDGLDHLMRKGEGPSSPEDYAKVRPVDPQVIGDIASFIAKGGC
ncbi:MAG: alpha/beta fold hydrolase [Acidobacteriota bacterium]